MATTTTTNGTREPMMTALAADRALRRYIDARAVGRRLAWARDAAGLSQKQLASYVGVSGSTLSRVELGERVLLPAERVAVSRALGTSIATFTAPTIAMPPASNGNGNGNGRTA